METKGMIQYDFSSLNEFFNEFETPDELMNDLIDIAFRYSMCYNDEWHELFNNNMSTLYLIYNELSKIKVINQTDK